MFQYSILFAQIPLELSVNKSSSASGNPSIFVNYLNAPSQIDFGVVKIGSAKTFNISIGSLSFGINVLDINIGNSVYSISDTSFNAPFFSSKTIQIGFVPVSEEVYSDTIRIISNDPVKPLIKIAVTGVGQIPIAEFTSDSIDYGQVNRGAPPESVRIPLKNPGDVDLAVTKVSVKFPADSGLFVFSDTVEVIPPGGQSIIDITFYPVEDKSYSSILTINTDSKNIPYKELAVTGESLSPEINVTSTSMGFDSIKVTQSQTESLLIINEGNAELFIDSLRVSESVFSITQFPDTISANDSGYVVISFIPDSGKSYSDTLSIYSGDPESPVNKVYLTGTGCAPTAVFSSLSVAFNSVDVGTSLVKYDTLTNTGNDTLVITGIDLPGSIYTHSIGTDTLLLPADTLIIGITFTPGALGIILDTMKISTNDPNNPNFDLIFSGTGTGPEINSSVTFMSFTNTAVGDTTTDSLEIYNPGTGDLIISAFSFKTASYLSATAPDTVLPGDTLDVLLKFAPSVVSKNIDTLTITSNAVSNPSVRIPLTGNNAAPSITSLPDTVFDEGDKFSYTIVATDVDSDVFKFDTLGVAPAGMTIDSLTGVLSWSIGFSDSGSYAINVEVRDELAAADTQMFNIDVSKILNAPEITSVPDTLVHIDSLYTYQVVFQAEADSADIMMLAYPISPTVMTIDSTGLISWRPEKTGKYDVAIRVTDTLDASTMQQFKIEVIPDLVPVITGLPDTLLNEDAAYSDTLIASDPEGSVLKYSLISGPAGLTIDSTSGQITWTPQNEHVGSNSTVFRVKDLNENYTDLTINFFVSNTNDAPVITAVNDTTVTEDQEVYIKLNFYDPDTGDSLSISDNTAMFESETDGTLRFSPDNDDVGANTVSVTVSDGTDSTTVTFVLTVLNTNDPPGFLALNDTSAYTGQTIRIFTPALDPDGDNVRYDIFNSPASAVIEPDTGVIIWTPDEYNLGLQTFFVIALDQYNAADTTSFNVNVVKSNKGPIFFNVPEIRLNEDQVKTVSLRNLAYDTDNEHFELSWQIIPGDTIDTKLTDSTIVISGPADWSGKENFTVIVTDPRNISDTLNTVINIVEVNDPPQIKMVSPSVDTTITENETATFRVSATDVETQNLGVKWFVEGDSAGIGNSYEFTADRSLPNPSTVSMTLTDNTDTLSVEWKVTIDIITHVEVLDFAAEYIKYKGIKVGWETGIVSGSGYTFDVVREINGKRTNINELPIVYDKGSSQYSIMDRGDGLNAEYYLIISTPRGDKQIVGPIKAVVPVPEKFELGSSYPNPFNNRVNIPFSTADPGNIKLHIYSTSGRLIKTIYSGYKPAGYHKNIWDGKNDNGKEVATGMYIVTLQTTNGTFTGKILLIK